MDLRVRRGVIRGQSVTLQSTTNTNGGMVSGVRYATRMVLIVEVVICVYGD